MKIILLAVMGIVLLALIYQKFHPVFGGKSSPENLETLKQSPNFLNGRFNNQNHTPMHGSTGNLISMVKDFLKGNPQSRPALTIPVQPLVPPMAATGDKQVKITWFGHSAFLLELDGKILLLDPMLGKYSSPLPLIGMKRYSEKPVRIKELPEIDAVLLSHDHYDHLDYKSIIKLKDKVKAFHVPLGVGNHLERWGVPKEKIKNYDWWEEAELGGLLLACTPAQHFSGRNLHDRNATLWCSWVIRGQDTSIFFSGDGGYGTHFAEIREKYGAFDVTLLECGQYDRRWKAIHMMPEESIQAHLDLQGKMMIPIHWGAFTLAFHSWTEPVERALKAAQERDLVIATPRISETIILGAANYPDLPWWDKYNQDILLQESSSLW